MRNCGDSAEFPDSLSHISSAFARQTSEVQTRPCQTGKIPLDSPACLWYNKQLRGKVREFWRVKTGGIRLHLNSLRTMDRVIGVKQSRRAIRDGLAREVFLASDADPELTGPLYELCRQGDIPVTTQFTMRELGQAAGIQVGAAVAVVL